MRQTFILLLAIASFKCSPAIPYGMIPISDFYIDDTEISNSEWLEFIYYQDLNSYKSSSLKARMSSTQFIMEYELLPDTTLLKGKIKNLFRPGRRMWYYPIKSVHSKSIEVPLPISEDLGLQEADSLLKFPIVGITYTQALKYCEWKSNARKLVVRRNSRGKFCLPSLSEFDKSNTEEDSVVVLSKSVCSKFNYSNCSKCVNDNIQGKFSVCGEHLLQIASFISNDYGLYDIQGNVCEMTNEEGLSYGGSYLHTAKQTLKGRTVLYTHPQKWIGFRTVYKK